MSLEPWSESDGDLILAVRVTPKASKTAIVGVVDTGDGRPALAVRVAAPPVDGAANAELVACLGKLLRLRKSAVAIVAGETARIKLVRLRGDPAMLKDRLATLLKG